MSRVHTILFDAGETLVEADDFFSFLAQAMGDASLRSILVKRFYPLLRRKPFSTIKDTWARLCAEMVREFGARPVDARAAYKDYFINHSRVYPDVIDALTSLRARGIKIILVSDADADVLHASLDKFGLVHFFSGMVISGEQRGYKPGPEMVEAARRFCAEPLDGILLVGDMDVDMEMAELLGVRGVLIDRAGKRRFPAPVRIESLRELLAIVEDS